MFHDVVAAVVVGGDRDARLGQRAVGQAVPSARTGDASVAQSDGRPQYADAAPGGQRVHDRGERGQLTGACGRVAQHRNGRRRVGDVRGGVMPGREGRQRSDGRRRRRSRSGPGGEATPR